MDAQAPCDQGLSVFEIGQKVAVLWARHDEIDNAWLATAEGSDERAENERQTLSAITEIDRLNSLALDSKISSYEDCAALAAFAFGLTDATINGVDLVERTHARLAILRRVLARIACFAADQAGLSLDRLMFQEQADIMRGYGENLPTPNAS